MSDLESLASSFTDSIHAETSHQAPQSLHDSLHERENFKSKKNSSKRQPRKDFGNDANASEINKELSEYAKKHSENHEISPSISSKNPASLKSYISTNTSRSSIRVPKNETRGLLSFVTLMPEYRDPRKYSHMQKITIVLIVAFAAVAGPMGTSILLPAVDDLTVDLHTTVSMVNISVGMYLLSLGIFPMWWSNFSEKHGRRSVYVLSFAWFLAFSVACAVAPNIESLIILRLLAGIGASAVQSCGAGTISDLYVQEERGTALGLFYLGPLFGPFISPILGGAVAQKWGWRASMWVMVIVCGLNLVSIILLLPETLPADNSELMSMFHDDSEKDEEQEVGEDLERASTNASVNSIRRQMIRDETPVDLLVPTLSRISTNQSAYSRRIREQHEQADLEMEDSESLGKDKKAASKPWKSILYDYTIRPLHAIVFLGYPPILLALTYSSIGFMGVYFLNISIANRYAAPPYNFSPVIVGLMYIPNSVTFILASIYGGKWNDWLIKRYAKSHNGELQPEARLSWNIVVAAIIYPPAALIFGWCLDKKQHWVTPLVGSALFGISGMLVMGTTVTYLVDSLPGKGATGVALNNLIRQILAAIATFVTEPIVRKIGTGALFSIYAGVITVAVSAVWVLKRHGPQFREHYDLTTYYAKL